jgi:WD repeat-containing protein 61
MSIQVVKIREFKGHSQAVYSICKAVDQDVFYSAGGDGMLVRWQLDEPDGTLLARHESAVYSVFANGAYLMTGTREGLLSVFDNKDFQLSRRIKLSDHPVFDLLEWHHRILVAAGDGSLYVLDEDFNLMKTIRLSNKSLRKMEPMGEHLAVASSDGIIRILDRQLNPVSELGGQSMSVFALAYNSITNTLISGGREAVLRLYKDGQQVKTIAAHLLHIHCISLNEAQTLYLTCSMDKTIKLWDSTDDTLLKVIDHGKYDGHTSSVNKILWFDKNNFISCSDDRTLKCYEILKK